MNEYLSIYKEVITKRYVQFSGRASRKEYWTFSLINIAIFFVLYAIILIGAKMQANTIIGIFTILLILITLALFLPTLAISVRRLHDISKSGYYYFVNLVPIIGPIIFLIFTLTAGHSITNQWGPNPYEN